ncbi:MAG: hypothetical protein ACXAC2_22800 [Candidatus Kariarchaeaceae archaeon]|jgi:hypothetical protein
MKQNSDDYSLFSGLVLWGSEHLPQDLFFSLGDIRQWAVDHQLIWDTEAQFVASERIDGLSKHFTPEHKLSIHIHLYIDDTGNLAYAEYPYLPIKSLIKMDQQVEVVYWEMMPSVWDSDWSVKEFGEVHLGFWIPNVSDEFCSVSTAKLIVERFHELYHDSSKPFERKTLDKGVLYVEVNEDVKARFFKSGRLFDVELSSPIQLPDERALTD